MVVYFSRRCHLSEHKLLGWLQNKLLRLRLAARGWLLHLLPDVHGWAQSPATWPGSLHESLCMELCSGHCGSVSESSDL